MANLQFPEMATDGITIELDDAAGNPLPASNYPDPATVTTVFTASDPSVIAITPDPASPYDATAASNTKAGANQTISCTLNFKSGAPSITGTSDPFDVPANQPVSMKVKLGPTPTPTPPLPQAKKRP